MTEVSIGVAVAAGLLSFISPCVLALLPVYLAFLGNAAVADDSGTVAATRAAVLPQALLFVAGFSVLFILLGTAIGVLGGPLLRIPEARQVAGVLVILLGLLTTGIFGPVLDRLQVGVGPEWLPAARSTRARASRSSSAAVPRPSSCPTWSGSCAATPGPPSRPSGSSWATWARAPMPRPPTPCVAARASDKPAHVWTALRWQGFA